MINKRTLVAAIIVFFLHTDTIAQDDVPEIIVTAQNNQQTTSATRLPMKMHETPRTINWLNKSNLNDTEPLRIEDAVAYLPNVSAGITQNGFNTSALIRGFNTGDQVFVNGHQDNLRFFNRDFSTLDHVEVLKGHSSVLYGSGAPGGVLNYLTKQPAINTQDTLSVSFGSHQLKRLSVDKSGTLNEDNAVHYRFIATTQDSDHFYDHADNDRWIVAPSVSWQYRKNSRLQLDLEMAHSNTPLLFGTVYTHGAFLYDQSYIDPRAKSDRNFKHLRLYWDHALTQQWQWHTTLANYHTKRDDRHIGFFYKLNEEQLLGYYREVNDDHTQSVMRTELHGLGLGDTIKHDLVIGIEKNKDNGLVDAYRIIDFVLDIHHPQFDTDFSQLDGQYRQYRIKNSETGIYAMDHIRINRAWNVLLGARYSHYDTQFIEHARYELRDRHTTAKSIAVNYHPSSTLAFYGSVSESFAPNTGQDRHHRFFDPKHARQYEIGLRKTSAQQQLSLQVALFNIEQDNLLTVDLTDRDYKTLAGAQQHRGAEFALTYTPTPQLSIHATYAYLDAKITKNNDGLAGHRPTNTPKHTGAVHIHWQPFFLPNATYTLGLIGADQRYGDRANSFTVPGYGRVDMGFKYAHNNITLSLSAINLLDKDYITSAEYEDDIYRGRPRTVTAGMTYHF